MAMDIREQVILIIAEHAGMLADKIEGDDILNQDLEMDSLDMAEMVVALEEKFEISIDDEESDNFIEVDDVVKCIEEKLNKK